MFLCNLGVAGSSYRHKCRDGRGGRGGMVWRRKTAAKTEVISAWGILRRSVMCSGIRRVSGFRLGPKYSNAPSRRMCDTNAKMRNEGLVMGLRRPGYVQLGLHAWGKPIPPSNRHIYLAATPFSCVLALKVQSQLVQTAPNPGCPNTRELPVHHTFGRLTSFELT